MIAGAQGSLPGWERAIRKAENKAHKALAAAVIGTFAVVLQGRITGIGLRDLGGAMGLAPDEALWINTAFTVCEVASVPFAIRYSAHHSIRIVFMPAMLVFTAASLLTLPVQSFEGLLALRCLQGLAAGCIIPMATPVFARSLPHWDRLKAFAAYGVAVTVPISLAPFVETLCLEYLNYRFLFVPAGLLGAVACWLGRNSMPQRDTHRSATRLEDRLGLVLPALGAALCVLATEQANRLDWIDADWVRGLGLAGLLVLCASLVHLRSQPAPALKLRVLQNRNYAIGLLTFFFFRISLLAIVWAVPDFLVRITRLRPEEFFGLFLLMVTPQLILPFVGARFARKVDLRLVMGAALAFQAAACLQAFAVDDTWAVPEFAGIFLLHGIGQGLYFIPNMALTAVDLAPDQRGTAGTLMHFARIAGGAIGASVVGTLFTQTEQRHHGFLNEYLASGRADALNRIEAIAHRLEGRAAGNAWEQALSIVHGSVQRQAHVLAYADIFAGIGVVLLCVLALQLWVRPIRLRELDPLPADGT